MSVLNVFFLLSTKTGENPEYIITLITSNNVNELIKIFLFLVFFLITDKISKKAVLP